MLTRIIVSTLCLLTTAPLSPLAQTPATIQGVIVAAENNAALPRARVAVSVEGTRQQWPSVYADDRGRFTVNAPTDGPVTLVITKSGFATAQRVPRATDRSGDRLRIMLNRSASIAGRVTDAKGDVAIDVPVFAVRTPGTGDGSTPDRFETSTNDLGEFRVGGLPAGRYDLTAGPPTASGKPSVVDVRAGDEAGPIDLVDPRVRPLIPQAKKPLTGALIRGRVLGPGSRPVSSARVRAIRNGYAPFESRTDAQGRFAIDDLDPGSYSLEASREGFVTVQYGQTRAAEPGLQLTVRKNEALQDIDLVLSRGSAVTGLITDERGEPLEGVTVRALQLRHGNGRTAALPAMGVRERRTDDRGRYRLFGLLPGSYLIVASVDATISGAGSRGYARVFHPGSTDVADAVPVAADLNRDIAAIDFVFHQMPAARVTGIALDSSGRPMAAGTVLLAVSQRSGNIALEPSSAPTGKDGSFVIANVPPGDYVVQAFKPRSRDGEPEFGTQFVTVVNDDPKPVTIRTSIGATLKGRLVIEGPELEFTYGPSVLPMPADFDYAPMIGPGTYSVSQSSDFSFAMAGLFGPTRFRVSGGRGGEWYLKSLFVGPVDIADTPFDFGLAAQTIPGAEVVMSNAGATIAGHVTDARSVPVVNYSVLVFSTDRTKWFANSRFLKFGRPAQDGGFEVSGLPPGEYWVVAVDAIQGNQSSGEWEKPEVLDPLTPRATRVTLAERERFMTVLRLTRR